MKKDRKIEKVNEREMEVEKWPKINKLVDVQSTTMTISPFYMVAIDKPTCTVNYCKTNDYY